jgi:signal transduction histidine kinase/CheY-like chemotaxis protein
MAGRTVAHGSAQTLAALVDASDEGLLAFDASGTIVSANPAAHELLGVAGDALAGAGISALGNDDLVSRVSRALDGGSHSTGHFMVTLGERSVVGRTVRPRGGETAVVLALRDDTRLAEERDSNRAVLAATADGLVLLTPDDTVSYINPAALAMLHTTERKLLGKRVKVETLLGVDPVRPIDGEPAHCKDVRACHMPDCPAYAAEDIRCWLVDGTVCGADRRPRTFAEKRETCLACDYHTDFADVFDALDGVEPQELELEHDGEQLIVKVAVSAVVDSAGDYIGRVVALRDITTEREIADMKNEFVSTVSHELRTPLTSIKGYVDLILDGSAGEINDVQQEFLGIVKENSDRLVELINEMLDISRIESGRVHLRVEPLNIAESIEGAVDTFRAVMSQTGRTVDVRVPAHLPLVVADRDRVGQVLINLVSNALKYSPGGGEVVVTASHTGDRVCVAVTDQGLGISKDDLKRLFTKFYRVDSAMTREIGGTGLGLSICKNIIELLGGEVSVKSKLGSGSTFSFTLPVASDDLVRTPELAGPDQVEGTVLVVDRDPYVADLIETYLVKRGYSVVKAHTADEAFDIAKRTHPGAITLDVILEGTDGFDLLHRLKEEPTTAKIPVVVLSIVCDEGRSCRLGAANYLEKPIDHGRLLDMIDQLVGGVSSPVALVVDDDRDVVKFLSETLRKKGFAVIGAYDGAEAIASLEQRQRPDIIVTDLKMPKVDGYELIQKAKRTPEWADIPIVVMTAHRIDPERIDILDLATYHLNKPLSPEAIAEQVGALLEAKGVMGAKS